MREENITVINTSVTTRQYGIGYKELMNLGQKSHYINNRALYFYKQTTIYKQLHLFDRLEDLVGHL